MFRILFLALIAAAFGIILFGYIGPLSAPAQGPKSGQYTAQQIENPRPSTGASYSAPETIGTPHTTDIETLWGFGPSTPLSWYGLGSNDANNPRPAIILFHGPGRDGRSMLDMWDELATQKDIILIAPNAAAAGWSYKTFNAPNVATILADAQEIYAIDPDKTYLFGHSGGAKLVQKLANSSTGPWRAVASHAGVLDHTAVAQAPTSPLPIQIFNGDTDPNYPVWYVEKSANSFAQTGHDVSVTIIKNHTHWYYDLGPKLAPIIWDGLINVPTK